MNNNDLNHFIEQLHTKGYTTFLNPLEYKKLSEKIQRKKYHVYYMYKDCTKVILYTQNIPHIVLCKITSKIKLTHPAILKEMFNLGIKEEMYGDIIIGDNNESYIYLLPQIKEYFIYNFKSDITDLLIEEIPVETLANYKIKFQEINISVTSLRIDNVISSLISQSRKDVLTKFKDKEVILNYEVVTKYIVLLKEGEVFSIRKYGKYYFAGVIRQNKKGKLLLKLMKYI